MGEREGARERAREREMCVLPQFALEITFSTFIHSLTAQSFFEEA